MTNRDRVLEALESNTEGMCVECVRKACRISRPQTVFQICTGLKAEGIISRERGVCTRCTKTVLVNKIQPTRAVKESNAPEMSNGTQSWFDQLRAKLVRALNLIDPSSRAEPFSKRVTSLRDKRILQGNVASWMLTWTSLRNIVAFEGYLLTDRETRIARLVREELEVWVSRQGAA